MNASQQQLQRLVQLYRLRDLYILKDNIGLEFNHMHYNKPARKIDHVFNKALKEEIANVVDGTGSNVKTVKELKNIIPDALKQQQKTLVKNPDRFIKHAVKSNSKDYGKILQNRVKKETHNLTAKIEQERIKTTYEGLLDNKLKKELYRNLKGKVAARPKNIVKDALHTNQSNIGFIKALNEGYLYKEWMNGRKIMMRGGTKKSRTRPWHRASIIDTVPVDEYFDIYGSYHAQLMYPGDLNGGAENVANCRCWSRYTNTKPTGLGRKGNGGTKTGKVQSFTDLWKQKLSAKSTSKSTKRNSNTKTLQAKNEKSRTKAYYNKSNKNNKTTKQNKQSVSTKIKDKVTSLTLKTKNIKQKIKTKIEDSNLEKIANEFGLKYYGEVKQHKDANNPGKYHKFYDKQNDCTLFISKDLCKGKNRLIDLKNKNHAHYNLNEILQMYVDAPLIDKKLTTSISFVNRRDPESLGQYANYKQIFSKNYWDEMNKRSNYFGKRDNYIEIFRNGIEPTKYSSENLQRTLYHEMAHSRNESHFGGLHISETPEYKKTIKTEGFSSWYGEKLYADMMNGDDVTWKLIRSEDIAETISMMSFKNINKKGAVIVLPDDSILYYDDFVKEFGEKIKLIEKGAAHDKK